MAISTYSMLNLTCISLALIPATFVKFIEKKQMGSISNNFIL